MGCETVNGQPSVSAIGGTSLATPTFSYLMAIAAQDAGHGLGQAAQALCSLPASVIVDIKSVGSSGDVAGFSTSTNAFFLRHYCGSRHRRIHVHRRSCRRC